MVVHCPQCQGVLRVEGPAAGKNFGCPFCNAGFFIDDHRNVVLCSSPETPVRIEHDAAFAFRISDARARNAARPAAPSGSGAAFTLAGDLRPRLSRWVVVAFGVTCVSLVYSLVAFFLLTIVGPELLLNLPVDFDHLQEVLVGDIASTENDWGGIWFQGPAMVRLPAVFLSIALFAPLLVPIVLNFIAFAWLLSAETKGGGLLTISAGLCLGAGLTLVAAVDPMIEGSKRYAAGVEAKDNLYRGFDGSERILTLLRDAQETQDPLTRLAVFHNVAHLGAYTPPPIEAHEPLVELSLRHQLTSLERNAALVLLIHLFDEGVVAETEGEPAEWVRAFARRSRGDRDPTVRNGYLTVLSRTASRELSDVFWEALTGNSSRNRRLAVQWWTNYAPLEALADFGARALTEARARDLTGWLTLLETSQNERFTHDRHLRQALLGALTEHADSDLRERATRLIEEGPWRH